MKLKYIITGIVITCLLLLVAQTFTTKQTVQGSAPSGLASTVATSGVMTLSGTNSFYTIVATSTGCAARIISITDGTGKGINLTFSDRTNNYTLAGHVGHFQVGSTTQVYDAGLYGCGAIMAATTNAATSSIVTVTETR